MWNKVYEKKVKHKSMLFHHSHEDQCHEEVCRCSKEELSPREDLDGGVVDGSVEREADHWHQAVQRPQHGRNLACGQSGF